MVRSLLIRGMLAGLFAGLLVFGYAKAFGEQHVERAIAFEEHGHTHSHDHEGMTSEAGEAAEPQETELFSRDVQGGIGLFTGVAAYSAGIGGLFALVFAVAYGRAGRVTPRVLSALLALSGFVAVNLVPMLKYPANPPSIGNPDTIGSRTALYFAMLAISVLAVFLAIKLWRYLLVRLGSWNAAVASAIAFVFVIGAAQMLLPEVNEVPEGFPADLLWNFRLVSLGMHLVLWSALGLLFGELAERAIKSASAGGKLSHT